MGEIAGVFRSDTSDLVTRDALEAALATANAATAELAKVLRPSLRSTSRTSKRGPSGGTRWSDHSPAGSDSAPPRPEIGSTGAPIGAESGLIQIDGGYRPVGATLRVG